MKYLIVLAALLLLVPAGCGTKTPLYSAQELGIQSVVITHCVSCNFKPQAEYTAAVIKKAFGIESQLEEGTLRAFNIEVDGIMVFMYRQTKRFPGEAEIIELIKARKPVEIEPPVHE